MLALLAADLGGGKPFKTVKSRGFRDDSRGRVLPVFWVLHAYDWIGEAECKCFSHNDLTEFLPPGMMNR